MVGLSHPQLQVFVMLMVCTKLKAKNCIQIAKVNKPEKAKCIVKARRAYDKS